MEKGCNIRDVAKKANVSPGTVSRVLNNRMGKTRVSEKTKMLIIQCAKKMDYQPNINAQRMFSKRSMVIGLVVPSFLDIQQSAFEDNHIINILCGIEQVLSSQNYKLMILFKDKKFEENREHVSLFQSKQVDGLLIWGARRHEFFWNKLREIHYPHIFISTYPDKLKDDKYVFSADYAAAGYDIMGHLLKQKHAKILWGKSTDNSSVNVELNKGFRQACHDKKCNFETVLSEISCEYSPIAGYQLMERVQKNKDKKNTAILFTSNEAASGALEYCTKHRLRVPEDVAIAACDSSAQRNSLSKITCPTIDDILLGSTAVEGLLAQIGKRELPVNNRIRTTLHMGSTA